MRAAHAMYVAMILVSSAPAGAERPVRSGTTHVRTVRSVVEQARPAIDLVGARALGRRVLGARMKLVRDPVIERDPTWIEMPEPAPAKEFQPRVMVNVVGFPTGGGGVRIKLRY